MLAVHPSVRLAQDTRRVAPQQEREREREAVDEKEATKEI
jgi:hypothetical protein